MNNDPRTPITTDVAHDLREMFGEEFGLFFVEVPPAPETQEPAPLWLLLPGKDTPWWLCPNEPRCPHARLFHDIEDYDDPLPRCCAEGCDCGKRPEPVTHLCPPEGGVCPCCGKTPFELPGTDRITEDPSRVTCAAITEGSS